MIAIDSTNLIMIIKVLQGYPQFLITIADKIKRVKCIQLISLTEKSEHHLQLMPFVGEFKSTMAFMKGNSQLHDHCVKCLSLFAKLGGSLAIVCDVINLLLCVEISNDLFH